MESGVLDGDAGGQGQRLGEVHVLGVEGPAAELVREVEVAVDLVPHLHRDAHERAHRRVAGGKSGTVRMVGQIVDHQGDRVVDQGPEHAESDRSGPDPVLFGRGKSDGDELGQAVTGGIEHAEGAVPGAGHGARLGDHVTEQDTQLEVTLDEPGGLQDASQLGVVGEGVQAHGTAAVACSVSASRTSSRADDVEWPGEQVALTLVDVLGAQPRPLVDRLDPLGHGLEPEHLAQLDERVHDGRGLLGVGDGGHEGLVDLEDVDRELPEVGERRIAGAEVVDRDPDAECLEAVELVHGGPHVTHQDRLGELEDQEVGPEAGRPPATPGHRRRDVLRRAGWRRC